MFYFNQPDTPAAKSHLNAQLSFFNDMSKTLFRSAKKVNELNINLAQSLMEESTQASHEMLTAKKPLEALSSTATQAQPFTEKLRIYQKHLNNIAADAGVDIAKCTEEHVQETTRTAKALADEVAQITNDEIDQAKQRQIDAANKNAEQIRVWQSGDGSGTDRSSQSSSSRSSSGESGTGMPLSAAQASAKQQANPPRKDA